MITKEEIGLPATNRRSFMLLAVSGVLVAHLSWCLLAVSTRH